MPRCRDNKLCRNRRKSSTRKYTTSKWWLCAFLMDWLLLWTTDWYILNIEFDSLDNSVVYASSSSVRARPYIKIWWSFPISNAAWKMMRCNTIRSNWPAVLHVRMWWMWCALKLEIVNGHVCSRSSTGNVVYTMLASRYFIFRFLVYHSSPALHQNKSSNIQERL